MALINIGFPEGSAKQRAYEKQGCPPFKNLGTAKADGMEFPHWEPVVCSSARQEQQIADFCRDNNVPIVVFSEKNGSVIAECMRRRGDEIPTTYEEFGEFISAWKSPSLPVKVRALPKNVEDTPINSVGTGKAKKAAPKYDAVVEEQLSRGRSQKQAEYTARQKTGAEA